MPRPLAKPAVSAEEEDGAGGRGEGGQFDENDAEAFAQVAAAEYGTEEGEGGGGGRKGERYARGGHGTFDTWVSVESSGCARGEGGSQNGKAIGWKAF